MKTQYFTKTGAENENTINNCNNEIKPGDIFNIIKDKNFILSNQKAIQKNYLKNQNNINKKSNIFSKAETSLDASPKRNKRKNGLQKFMESVTERVNQINHHNS